MRKHYMKMLKKDLVEACLAKDQEYSNLLGMLENQRNLAEAWKKVNGHESIGRLGIALDAVSHVVNDLKRRPS